MANNLDGAVTLDSSAVATPAGNPGGGSLQWGSLGVTRMAIFTGTGSPVGISAAVFLAAGLPATGRAFYLDETGGTGNTLMYYTLNGGTLWVAAALV
jgi:hypothetical protein